MRTTTLATLVGLVAVTVAAQSVPPYVNYQGRLTDASGSPLATGDYALKFTIWDNATGGSQVWGPLLLNAPVIQGYFNVILGDANGSILNAFNGTNRYLQIEITAGPPGFSPSGPILPRQQVLSTPYAFRTGPISAVAGEPESVRLAGTSPVLKIDASGIADQAALGWDNNTTLALRNRRGPLNLYGNNGATLLSLGSGIAVSPNFTVNGTLTVAGNLAFSTMTGNTLTANSGVIGKTGSNKGVSGLAGNNGTGVYGDAGSNGIGVAGACQDGIGVWGGGPVAAGWFDGPVVVNGLLHKRGGGFKIDHPLEPARKYLYHSFVESPDMMNIYNGNVTTDESGLAVIHLPDWFEALNKDFRYQLTVIGQFAQVIVERKIEGNRFTIRTSQANVEVSWQVTGIRKDAYAEAHRVPVEQDKPGVEQGTYLNPELFGQPEGEGVSWALMPQLMQQMKADREASAAKPEN